MTHATLFSGIGAPELAAQWLGWTNVFNCEIDSFCRNVLKYHFPDAKQYTDIRKTDFSVWRGRIDVLAGGFPCQPFSQAGRRKGTDDERHLWPEMLRAIREIRPRWIVGENVLGLVNWNGGMVFEQVCTDLESEGYEVWAGVLPVAGVNGLHLRNRLFIVAHTNSDGLSATEILGGTAPKVEIQSGYQMSTLKDVIAHDFRSESSKHGVIDGIPAGLDECSLHAYGNAIAPQVIYQIYRAIHTYEYGNGRQL